ncbi:VCBS repeat-containing protein [Danxiaibacter flavus]|uniref:VCBS repeat-containing protein n=1 Tax=Danxiaibacter flavus TaxID=3049108 RepID=A0ABV3ZID9_9BACT|nr:VCBS repeat-containing protein [Chitinophagaceae bacterium DXS]
MMKQLTALILACGIIMASCKSPGKEKLFTKLSSGQTGIHFSNDIDESLFKKQALNEFAYMGGGVGIGDFNNDGLKDIFFCGNQVSSRLYVNKGENKFDDITEKAGVFTTAWCTGVSIVDINGDGYDDIYVCNYGKGLTSAAANQLFINQHDLTFKEEAASYGLADSSYSTQAAFFDFDLDGDLDMYLLNYRFNGPNANTIFPKDLSGHSPANDKLYRNDGKINGAAHPVFTDVSMQAGIKEDGYGLGVSVSDFNNDGWPDIYVSNDFLSNDVFWLNNRNGTFSNRLDAATKHQSYSSMGCDAADINNDALVDFATLDMMPEDNKRKKLTYSFMNYERYETERSLGYSPEFMRNMLQLNNGNWNMHDTAIPFFSEIGQMAGISETDWSWSVLLADFDNDGWKDAHITNGIGRDFINSDFIQFTTTVGVNTIDPEKQRQLMNEEIKSLDHVNLPNYLYINNHNYSFRNASHEAGIDQPSLSTGCAYADLDNDGDLDLVVNNINGEAFVFNNNSMQTKEGRHHYLGFNLVGESANREAIGTKIYVYKDGKAQLQEQEPVRGYLSTVDRKLIFGLGDALSADSVVISWPGSKRSVVKNVRADSVYRIEVMDAVAAPPQVNEHHPFLFSNVTDSTGLIYKHMDVTYNDYAVQRLLPQKFSQLGPFIAVGDVNNDSLPDVFAGGGFNFSGKLFTQQKNGSFLGKDLVSGVKMQEDMDCVFLDVDNDGDNDLLISSGDTRYSDTSSWYKPRLYINDGKGNFSLAANALPEAVRTIAGCVAAGDYDNDGDMDLFIGGRVSKRYPLSPKSFILQNNKGIFTDVTATVCPALKEPGMITAAKWADYDGDGKTDLVVAGEWMPVRFFKNNGSALTEATGTTGLTQMNGMWRSLAAVDIDKDGDLDFVAGNLGLNCKYRVVAGEPMKLLAKDIDGNGSIDPVMFYYLKNDNGKKELFPAINRDQFADQVPAIKKMFLKHKDYTKADEDKVFKNKEGLLEFTCDETASCWLENKGNGKFVKHLLPAEAQFAPVNAIICDDLDGDGVNDLLLAGNEYQTEVMTGRYDASYGCFLKGTDKGTFAYTSPATNGFRVDGDVKDMKIIRSGNNKLILVAINNSYMKVFRVNPK